MLAFLRRWFERRVRTCIALAVGEQLEYEAAHAGRQVERLASHIWHERHGHYDPDQRTHSVLLKVQRAYAVARRRPPRHLQKLIAEALVDAG